MAQANETNGNKTLGGYNLGTSATHNFSSDFFSTFAMSFSVAFFRVTFSFRNKTREKKSNAPGARENVNR